MMTSPQTILITGASSGIGKALAASYAQRGKTLILIGRDARRLEDAAAECRSFGAVVEIGAIDVRDSEKVREFILRMDERHKIDLLIANAGVSAVGALGSDQLPSRRAATGLSGGDSHRSAIVLASRAAGREAPPHHVAAGDSSNCCASNSAHDTVAGSDTGFAGDRSRRVFVSHGG